MRQIGYPRGSGKTSPKGQTPAQRLQLETTRAKNDKLQAQYRRIALAHGFPPAVEEHLFDSVRKFRFDFAYPALKIAVELEGGSWTNGAHSRGVGYAKDCVKYNLAQLQGWRVFRFTGDMLDSGAAAATMEKGFKS